MRTHTRKSPGRSTDRGRAPSQIAILVISSVAALGIYSAAWAIAGMSLYRSLLSIEAPSISRVALGSLPTRLLSPARNHLAAFMPETPLEVIHLDIKFEALEKLRAKRAQALEIGVLVSSSDDFVPATIRHADRSIKAKIRLKGDMLDHLEGDKWSLRVQVRKNDQLFGMRRFSLQAPSVRDHQAEPIFLAHMRREGVLTPRYTFVDLVLNGTDLGVMAVEEHFSKELLEAQSRREGVILRFDESAFWQNLALNGTFGPYSNFRTAMLKPFRGSRVARSPQLSSDLGAAVGLMTAFMENKLSAEDVFDVELMARFMAVCEVWRTHHPLIWHNLRFYYNPLIARLEPVAFDGNVQSGNQPPGLVSAGGGFTPMLLQDEAFRRIFTRTLRRVASEMANGTIGIWASERERQITPALQEGMEYIAPLQLEALAARASMLAEIETEHFDLYVPPLGDPKMQFPEALTAHLCRACTEKRLELINTLPVPVEVLAIHVSQKKGAPPKLTPPQLLTPLPLLVPKTPFMAEPNPISVMLDNSSELEHFDFEFTVRVIGQDRSHRIPATDYFDALTQSPLPSSTLEEALARHPFLRIAPDSQQLIGSAGAWLVTGPVILPQGIGLTLEAGTELLFQKGMYLVASGPLRFEGSADRPIRLRPQEGTETWGGLVVTNSALPHVWRHVSVESTSGFEEKGWRLTGGITFRKADIEISDSSFSGSLAEDALNLIRSRFRMRNVVFHDSISDAFDADFSDGTIRGGIFQTSGGDGLDVSGATIDVEATQFFDIADKAISVGEQSRLSVRNVTIERVGTGIASKDASTLTFEDSFVGEAVVAGVSVYTKKPVYGPASAELARVEMRNVATPALVQAGSIATVDGIVTETLPFESDALY